MLDLEERGAVVIVRLSHGKVNALDLELLLAITEAIFDHPGPVVAAVNGHAIAGGCVIAAACDARLMSQGKIGLAELSVGVPFPPAAMEIMRHAAGPAVGHLVLTVSRRAGRRSLGARPPAWPRRCRGTRRPARRAGGRGGQP